MRHTDRRVGASRLSLVPGGALIDTAIVWSRAGRAALAGVGFTAAGPCSLPASAGARGAGRRRGWGGRRFRGGGPLLLLDFVGRSQAGDLKSAHRARRRIDDADQMVVGIGD